MKQAATELGLVSLGSAEINRLPQRPSGKFRGLTRRTATHCHTILVNWVYQIRSAHRSCTSGTLTHGCRILFHDGMTGRGPPSILGAPPFLGCRYQIGRVRWACFVSSAYFYSVTEGRTSSSVGAARRRRESGNRSMGSTAPLGITRPPCIVTSSSVTCVMVPEQDTGRSPSHRT